ncbi:(heptosyl)LPS beta-1,4-glucosyltransferase [Patescibacteria group bacterium]|nr:(heptosyl)LPS beta-1,4-glucosyltransferase [Patescibacteria group bacterium]
MTVSVIIITKNETSHIQACLESVSWADEIIVLDSGSTDNTVELCRTYTDKVYITDWQGFGIQKQRALNYASSDWVLSIDADETVTEELKAEIINAMQTTEYNGFEIPRLSNYCGRAMKHGGWFPDYVLRLFKREQGSFTDTVVHERIVVSGKIGRLKNPFLHNAFVNFEEVLHKVNHYSSLGADLLQQKNAKASIPKALFKGFWTFFRTYFLKAAFLDGWHGLLLAISNAEGAYYRYVKLWLLQQRTIDK